MSSNDLAMMMPSGESMEAEEKGGFMSVHVVIMILCLLGVVASSTSTAGLVVTSCDSALDDTRAGGSAATEHCFNTSNQNLNRVVEDLLGYASSSVEGQVQSFLNAAVQQSNWLRNIHLGTFRDHPKNSTFMDAITADLWLAIASLDGTGISGLGGYYDNRSLLLSRDGDTNTYITFRCEDGTGCFAGPATEYTGELIIKVPVPVIPGMLSTVKIVRDEPSLWNATAESVKWSGMDEVASFLGYTLNAVAVDPAGSTNHLLWIVTIELSHMNKFLVSIGNQIRAQTGSKTRIFTVIASSWIADTKKALGSFDWKKHDQRGLLSGVSNGQAADSYIEYDPLGGRNVTKYRPLHDVNATDEIISGVATAVGNHPGKYEGIYLTGGHAVLEVQYNNTNEDFYVNLKRVDDGHGIDWWLVTAIDSTYVISSVRQAEADAKQKNQEDVDKVEDQINIDRTVTYIILAATATSVLLLCTVTVHYVLKPIRQIQKEMSYVARMELERSEIQPNSRLKEVRRMQRDFKKMISNLSEYKAYVPAALLDETTGELSAMEPPTGDVTVMFTDIQGSTALWEKCAVAMNAAMEMHNEVIREAYQEHGGYEVKTIGDAFMVSFYNVRSAVLAAMDAQIGLQEQLWPSDLDLEDAGLKVRIGLHTGQTIAEINPLTNRADYRGPTINLASRVEGTAIGGTTCITRDVYMAIKPHLASMGSPVVVDFGTHDLKGLGSVLLYLLVPQQHASRVTGGKGSAYTAPNTPHSAGDVATSDTPEKKSGGSSQSRSARSTPLKIDMRTPAIQQHVQNKTGLSLSGNQMTVAVCKLVVTGQSKVFESFNLMVRAATEAAYATDGVVGSVTGRTMVILWNGTKKCPLHVTSALRFAAQLEQRAGKVVRLGIATGTLLHGNVGTQKKRFATTFGYPLDAAEAVVDHALHLDTFCLLCDCTADTRIGNDSSVTSFVRLVDSWFETTENKKLLIYELQGKELRDQLETWGATPAGPDRERQEHHDCIMKIWAGNLSLLDRLKSQLVINGSDIVLQNVVTMHEKTNPPPSEGYRTKVTFSHVPREAEQWMHSE